MVNLNLESKESNMNTSMGYEEPRLRREIKNFSFERNKTEESEDLFMKKEKFSTMPFLQMEIHFNRPVLLTIHSPPTI